MLLGRVVGTATATVRHASLQGWKLLVVQPLKADQRSADAYPLLAVDQTGAGHGDLVMLTSDGQGTREMMHSDTTPVRYSVLGIRD